MDKKSENTTTNTTSIGHVTGAVHTGSGDIQIEEFKAVSGQSLADLQAFIRSVREDVETLATDASRGMSSEGASEAVVELEHAVKEVSSSSPRPVVLRERLDSAKRILMAAAGAVGVATTTVAAIAKLIPRIDEAIRLVGHLFR